MTRYVRRPDADARPIGQKLATVDEAIAEGWYGYVGKGQGLQVIPDIQPYESPLGTGEISSRRARREEMKRHNVREVDPSEFKPKYTNERFARKYGLPLHQG